ncbi:ribosomal large subunit pseudouridine synthase D [Robiginitalea myxolifaciens]|uniref:Ribosomal large subunit pseudouridine synthase D n=1 Tax=Robiginitalea myxolifaciens TaxID=400055 RepID=A0A1I6GTY9_9FLAO|nr:RNA pseudouridine synthase [Robiginitalea myxolifaciens]SFR45527.1 ribosomal large subunit pseudouridine synthase D [Robiginitalea myxolifaciens]
MSRSTPENLQVLYEDNHLIAVGKRAGDIVQGDKTGDTPLSEVVKQYIAVKYNKPGAVFLGVIHRIDRPTSGIVIFARTSKALSRMNALFASGKTNKTYHAITQHVPEEASGTLEHYLERNPQKNKSFAYGKPGGKRKKAVLHYRILRKLERHYLWEITLETGRHHQIRAQLAALKCPIRGDLKYGAPRSNPDGSIHLHAKRLTFTHPVAGTEVAIEAPYPDEVLWSACT